MTIRDASKQFDATLYEIAGLLYIKGMPVSCDDFPHTQLTDSQREVLLYHYIISKIEDRIEDASGSPVIGKLHSYNEKLQYGVLSSSETMTGLERLYYYDDSIWSSCCGNIPKDYKDFVVFYPSNFLGYNVTKNIRKVELSKDKELIAHQVVRTLDKELFVQTKLPVIELIKHVIKQYWGTVHFNYELLKMRRIWGHKNDFYSLVKSDYVRHEEGYIELYAWIAAQKQNTDISALLSNKALYFLFPREVLLFFIIDYKKKLQSKEKRSNYSAPNKHLEKEMQKSIELLNYQKGLLNKTFEELCNELETVYRHYQHSCEQDNSYYGPFPFHEDTSERAIWDVMTDGQDYPDAGFDRDYESFGY